MPESDTGHPLPWRIKYAVVITDPPQSEALRTNCVRLNVFRIVVDALGMTVKREKVRDPETIKSWRGNRHAELLAVERGREITASDQRARNVRVTQQVRFRS